MTEQLTLTPLLEQTALIEAAAVAGDKHVVEVTLIRAGRSKNGNTYPRATLAAAVPLFEGAPAFADHDQGDSTLPKRSVRDIAGYYRSPHMDGDRLRAELHVLPGQDWLWHLLQECQTNPQLAGLSIDALGNITEGADGRQVDDIARVHSVDIVHRPSAGGSFDRILQGDTPQGKEPPVTPPAATPPAADPAHLVEQLTREKTEAQEELATLRKLHEAETARLTRQAACSQELVTLLEASKLPEPMTKKLRKRFDGRAFESAELTDAITEEQDTLAALNASGAVTGMGAPKLDIVPGATEYERVQFAFDGLFEVQESEAARAVPKLSGIREAFAVATGIDIAAAGSADRPLREGLQEDLRRYVAARRLTEQEVLLREADVTTASFSFLLGTSMNKRLLKDYQAWPSEWQKFTSVTAIKDFKQQDRIRLGSFGSLSTVAEDAAYTTLTLSDTRAIYTPSKRGNLVQITRETIINDDLYSIRQIPQKLAVAAAYTLAEFVYNLMAPNFGNIYDAHPLFDSVNHLNSAVIAANLNTANSGGALTSANMQTGIIKMRKQQNLASKPLGLKPRYVLTLPDLEFTAMTLLKSAGLPGGNNNDINPMMGYAEPIISPQLNALAAGPASTTSWILIADPRVIDTLEVGFVGGQQNPVLLIQDMPLYGLNFTQDVITYKVRHEYGGAVVDYRGFYLGNN